MISSIIGEFLLMLLVCALLYARSRMGFGMFVLMAHC